MKKEQDKNLTEQQKQVDSNFKAFEKKIPELIKKHQGKFALMRDEKIIDFFDSWEDAHKTGCLKYPNDSKFSIQEVTTTTINLGFFSCALNSR